MALYKQGSEYTLEEITKPLISHNLVVRPTEYTELQRLRFGVHSIMRVKLAQVVRVGGARPSPFTTTTITSKVAVYAPAEWTDTLTLFHL